MTDNSVNKIDYTHWTEGKLGQQEISSIWQNRFYGALEEEPREDKQPTEEDYETVGYVIDGCAELHIEGQVILLERGSSWVVPKWALYQYKILEPFTAIYRYFISGSKS